MLLCKGVMCSNHNTALKTKYGNKCLELVSKHCRLNRKCNRRNVIYKATTQNPDPHFYIDVL